MAKKQWLSALCLVLCAAHCVGQFIPGTLPGNYTKAANNTTQHNPAPPPPLPRKPSRSLGRVPLAPSPVPQTPGPMIPAAAPLAVPSASGYAKVQTLCAEMGGLVKRWKGQSRQDPTLFVLVKQYEKSRPWGATLTLGLVGEWEAAVGAKLSSERNRGYRGYQNVLRFIDRFEDTHFLYLVFEWAGATLSERLYDRLPAASAGPAASSVHMLTLEETAAANAHRKGVEGEPGLLGDEDCAAQRQEVAPSTWWRNDVKATDGQRLHDLLRQLVSAVEYISGSNVIHRQISPHNIFIVDGPNGRPILKLANFQHALNFDNADRRQFYAVDGAPYSMPPEVLAGSALFVKPVWSYDLFSAGEVFGQIATTEHLFEGASLTTIARSQLLLLHAGDMHVLQRRLREIDPTGQGLDYHPCLLALLQQLLMYDPARRISPAIAMQHPAFGRDPCPQDIVAYSQNPLAPHLHQPSQGPVTSVVEEENDCEDENEDVCVASRRVTVPAPPLNGATLESAKATKAEVAGPAPVPSPLKKQSLEHVA